MIKIAICDDSPQSIKIAKQLVFKTAQKTKKQVEVDTYSDGKDVVNRLLKKRTS
jgi:hypothetical protein